MKWINLPVKEWLPDQPDFGNPGVITATNVVPGAMSYEPLSSSVTYSVAPTTGGGDYIRGSHAVKGSDGVVHVFATNAESIFELTGTAWATVATSLSGTSTEYNTSFTEWGNTIIACKYGNLPRQSGPLTAVGATVFNTMSGVTFEAKFTDVVRDFVVFGFIKDSSVEYNKRVKWSAFNNANDYVQSVATQSDHQDLQTPGQITGFVGGKNGVVFQEYAITLMSYAGPPVIFRFDPIEERRGCRISGSIIRWGNNIFYISDEDAYLFDRIGPPIPLGAQKWIRYFRDNLNETYLHRVHGMFDAKRRIVMWAFPTASASNGVPDKILMFNIDTKRGSVADVESQALFNFLGPGYTIDTLDSVSGSIDALGFSLDSDVWKGGAPQAAAFNRNHRLFTFGGTPYDATIDLGEIRSAPGKNMDVVNIRPIVERGTVTAQIGHRKLQTDSPTWTTAVSTNTEGLSNVRVSNRFARVRLNVSGAFRHIQGADIQVRQAGDR